MWKSRCRKPDPAGTDKYLLINLYDSDWRLKRYEYYLWINFNMCGLLFAPLLYAFWRSIEIDLVNCILMLGRSWHGCMKNMCFLWMNRMFEGIFNNFALLIMIFGTLPAALSGVEIEKLIFGKRHTESIVRFGIFAFLWWWFCAWSFVDVLGMSFWK